MSCSSASVGVCRKDRITLPSSLVVMNPSPSLSNSKKTSEIGVSKVKEFSRRPYFRFHLPLILLAFSSLYWRAWAIRVWWLKLRSLEPEKTENSISEDISQEIRFHLAVHSASAHPCDVWSLHFHARDFQLESTFWDFWNTKNLGHEMNLAKAAETECSRNFNWKLSHTLLW